jgi:hypothetical protein
VLPPACRRPGRGTSPEPAHSSVSLSSVLPIGAPTDKSWVMALLALETLPPAHFAGNAAGRPAVKSKSAAKSKTAQNAIINDIFALYTIVRRPHHHLPVSPRRRA